MTTCPSCGIAGNNFSCPNHISYWGINPLPDSIPTPQHGGNQMTHPINTELFAEIGRLNILLNERDKEIAALKQTSADLCPECGWRFLVPGIGCQGCERARLEEEIERLKGLMPPDERGPGFVGQGTWSVYAEKVVAERDIALEKVAELTECLRWYVENDDTNEGGKWEESNASWLEGKRRAMRALGMEE
jgi:hypothetical protein